MQVVRNHKSLSENQCDKIFLRLLHKQVVIDMVTKIKYIALLNEEQETNKGDKLQRSPQKQ